MRPTSAAWAAMLSFVLECSAATASESWAGRRLTEALQSIERSGIRVIFSDRLVPPDMLIEREPLSADPVKALEEMLRPHALKLDKVSPGVYVVTRKPVTDIPAAPSSATEPLAQAEVTASRYRFEAQSLRDSLALDSGDLDAQPAQFNDAAQSIRRFPGTAGHTLSARTFVRGGSANENLFLLDGVPLHKPFHLQALPINFSVIDPSLLSRVDLYSGVQPLEHDGHMSALVDMRLSEPTESFGGRIAAGTLDTSALFSGRWPDDRGDWQLFGRRGLLDRASPFIRPPIGEPTTTDALARARYRLTDSSEWIVGALSAHDRVSFVLDDEAGRADDIFDRGYTWAAYEKRWEQLTSRTLVAHTAIDSQQQDELWDPDSGSSGTLDDNRDFQATLLKSDWTLAMGSDSTLRWGASANDEHADFDYQRTLHFPNPLAALTGRPPDEALSVAMKTELREYAAYLAVARPLTERLTIDGGVHWTHEAYSTDQSYSLWSPRMGLLLNFSPATRLRLSVGRMTQRQSADELPLEQNRLRFDAPSTNTMSVLSLEHEWDHRITLRTEIFDKRIHRPQPRVENVFSPDPLLPQLRPDVLIIAPDASRANGFDLYATAKLTESWSSWLSYSYSRSVDEIEGREVARTWDQPHSLGTGISFNRGGWLLSAVLSAHSGWPLTPLNNLVHPGETFLEPVEDQKVGIRSSVRQGFYYTLDLKGAWTTPLGEGSLSLALEISNVTDRRNTCCDDINYTDSYHGFIDPPKIETWMNREYWQPFLPYASIAWAF